MIKLEIIYVFHSSNPFLLDIWNKCKGKLKQNMVPLSIVKLLFRVNREKIYDIDVIFKKNSRKCKKDILTLDRICRFIG